MRWICHAADFVLRWWFVGFQLSRFFAQEGPHCSAEPWKAWARSKADPYTTPVASPKPTALIKSLLCLQTWMGRQKDKGNYYLGFRAKASLLRHTTGTRQENAGFFGFESSGSPDFRQCLDWSCEGDPESTAISREQYQG